MANPRRVSTQEQINTINERLQKGGGRRQWGAAQQAAQDSAFEALAAPLDIIEWIKTNWQAAIIIVVCLLILTR